MLTDTRLLHYEIHELLGSGSSGKVFRATDTRLDRPVALKFLHGGLQAKDEAVERFRAEAKAAARLDHPNIGSVYAIEYASERQLFISMAYYPGDTVSRMVARDGCVPLAKALDITAQVLRGLGRAHQAGVVHRDIKPANVMILPDGLVKILDFGIAKAADVLHDDWGEPLVGTVEYMSPQQVRGEEVDQRADIWAVGALLYKMLHGESPFFDSESPFAMIYNIATKVPPKLSDLHPELPGVVDTVLERALSKALDRRYADADEFLQDLELIRGVASGGGGFASVPDGRRSVGGTVMAGCPNNLPARLPLLVGRFDEQRVIRLYLGEEDSRAVTLVGPGGIGKTTLALHAAQAELRERSFLHGVYFVPLDSVPKPELMAATIAQTIGCRLQGPAPLAQQVAQFINGRHMLLVLDGVEHLKAGVVIVSELLESCPNLKLLLTSRERLNLPDEWIVVLQGLALPAESTSDPDEALAFDSISLFVRHAQRASQEFTVDDENLPFIIGICRFLQGHPLGIELAAGWTRHLKPSRIAAEIQQSYDFLASRDPGVKARHLSIRAVFEHSWGLLGEQEQEALERVSIFRGSFTRAAAAAVADTPLWLLAELVDKSLLQVSDEERFEQHPLWRQYGREKLAEDSASLAAVLGRHAEHYLEYLLRHGARLRRSDQGPEIALIEDEIENIRLAWETAVDLRDADRLAAAAEPIRTFFDLKGRAAEGAALLRQAIAALDDRPAGHSRALDDLAAGHSSALGHLHAQLAWLTLPSGNVEAAAIHAQEAVAVLEKLDEHRGLYWAVNSLGAAAAHRGGFDDAKRHFDRCRQLAESLEDSALLAASLDNLAGAEQALGRAAEARRLYETALGLARHDGNTGQIVATLNNLGALLVTLKLPLEARPLLVEGLALARESGAERFVPFCLANLGEVNYLLGEYADAAKAYQEGIERAREGGNTWLECALLADLARVAAFLNDLEQAQALLRRSLELAEEIKDNPLYLHAATCFVEAARERTRADARELARLVLRHPQAHIDDRNVCAAAIGSGPQDDDGAELPDGWKGVVRDAVERLHKHS